MLITVPIISTPFISALNITPRLIFSVPLTKSNGKYTSYEAVIAPAANALLVSVMSHSVSSRIVSYSVGSSNKSSPPDEVPFV